MLTCLVVETAVVEVLQAHPRLERIEERVYCLPPAGTDQPARLIRKHFWRFEGTTWTPMEGESPQPIRPDEPEWTGPPLGPTPSNPASSAAP